MSYTTDDRSKRSPTLKFTGTVKLHGTNAAIAYQKNVGYWYQSRNRVITSINDNFGFAEHMDSLAETFFAEHVLPHCPAISEYHEQGSTIVIYGEWCGGNIQDQSNVAITGLTKMFVIFKIKIISRIKGSLTSGANARDKCKGNPNKFWLDPKEWAYIKWHEGSIYSIYEFPTYDIDIDFNAPELSQNALTQITEEIERQCPVGAYFNRIGCGEGVVWTEWKQTYGCLTFKVKGRKYSVINSKTLAPICAPKMNSVQDFVEYACTKNRMQQAYNSLQDELVSIETKHFNTFIRWLTEDIIKEEKDTMDASNINARDVTRAMTSKAEAWFNHRLIEDHKLKSIRKKTSK
jgi:hypothetical protein